MASTECPFCHKLLTLHEQQDDEVVWQFAHSVAFLGTWQAYQGYCVLVARRHATELSHLGDRERVAYLDEMCQLARAIEITFQPRKLNHELLGNQVPHLHWHVFPRYLDDPDIRRPVWFAIDRAEQDREFHLELSGPKKDRAELASLLRARLLTSVV